MPESTDIEWCQTLAGVLTARTRRAESLTTGGRRSVEIIATILPLQFTATQQIAVATANLTIAHIKTALFAHY